MFTDSVAALDTPALLVDLPRLRRNLSTFAKIGSDADIAVRPHAKTHKTVEVGRLQLEAGAVGLTVAKLSEAAVYVRAGFDDIFVAYPIVGEQKWTVAAELARRSRLIVGVDSGVGILGLAAAAAALDTVIDVRVEFNSGLNRSGVSLEELKVLCAQVMEHASLRLEGIFSFRSNAFSGAAGRSLIDIGTEEGQLLAKTGRELRDSGFSVNAVSGGSTPTARAFASVPGVTEMRPGTYAFHDLTSRNDGACDTDDIAISVLTTIVSRPSGDFAMVDAGTKTLGEATAVAPGGGVSYGEVCGGGGYLPWAHEEHGALELTDGFEPKVGDRVRLYPTHVCTAVNLADRLVVVEDSRVVAEWEVAARGCNR